MAHGTLVCMQCGRLGDYLLDARQQLASVVGYVPAWLRRSAVHTETVLHVISATGLPSELLATGAATMHGNNRALQCNLSYEAYQHAA